jgi:PmbA protein
MSDYRDLAADLLRRAQDKGATAGDVVVVDGSGFNVQVRLGAIDQLSSAREKRLGLRLFAGQRMAIGSTADFSDASLQSLVDDTVRLARATAEDPFAGLPEPGSAAVAPPSEAELGLFDPAVAELPTETKIEMAKRAEATALAADPRIVNSEGGSLSQGDRRMVYANTNGFRGGYASTSLSLSVSPLARADGSMQRDYWYSVAHRLQKLEAPEAIGRTAAQRTLRRLGARKVATCRAPVIFDSETAAELLGSLNAAVSGYSIYKGASYLIGRVGTRVAAAGVTVVDDGRLAGGLGSRPFDGEGLPTRRTVVVENGILQSYLLDSYSGRKLGLASTGNAARSVADAPAVAPTNFYLAAGTHAPEQMIRSVRNGLYVYEMIGFGVNLVTGDYSRGASGIWIENGELAFPVQEVTIAGNLNDIFQNIEMIGTDLEFRGSISAPSLKISEMTIAGD